MFKKDTVHIHKGPLIELDQNKEASQFDPLEDGKYSSLPSQGAIRSLPD